MKLKDEIHLLNLQPDFPYNIWIEIIKIANKTKLINNQMSDKEKYNVLFGFCINLEL